MKVQHKTGECEALIRIALCEVACEENSRGLKFFPMQFQRINVNDYEEVVGRMAKSFVRRLTNKCWLRKGCKRIRITNQLLLL